jgi:alkyl hydroperoxide reductase subunit AhpC
MCLQPYEEAPDFTADAVTDGGDFTKISLSDYRGKWVVLFFYPLDFTFVCPTEITQFSKELAEFTKLNAQVIGASVDSKFSHQAWLKDLGNLGFPLISDITKEISDDYGVLIEDEGISLRGTFIINPDGIIQYININNKDVGRDVNEILRVLSALQTGGLCPANWKVGEKTL